MYLHFLEMQRTGALMQSTLRTDQPSRQRAGGSNRQQDSQRHNHRRLLHAAVFYARRVLGTELLRLRAEYAQVEYHGCGE